LSTQHPQATPTLPAAGAPQTRASDADRDAAAALLGAAFAEGRLTADEHGERLSGAYAARTWQQLRQLTADLPGTAGATERRAAPGMVAGPDRCLLCVLLIVCPPAGIAWWLLSRRRPAADPRRALRREGEHAQDR
jgi:pyruvate/2-oxoglutarate dehydrogenase complex dihydrolipoamide acyltransferase (E2) component